jgi:hypothetical protein
MADKKISQLPASTTPLAGTEVIAVVQSGDTKKVAVSDLTNGRDVSVLSLDVVAGASASDGFVQRIYKDTTLLGELGIGAGGQSIYFGQGATVLLALNSQSALIPRGTNGAARTGQISLGTATNRFNEIHLAGNVVIGTAGKGIDFSADANAAGMTSELLNDYEEGNWTPTYLVETGTITANANSTGKYVKIGRNVYIWGYVSYASNSGASGLVTVGGLPFTSTSSGFGQSGGRAGGVFSVGSNLFASNAPNSGLILSGSNEIEPSITTATGFTRLTFADFITSNNNSQFVFAGQYLAA